MLAGTCYRSIPSIFHSGSACFSAGRPWKPS